MTLFEVLLALAIFVGAMAGLGQLIANGVRGAVQAKLQTEAILRCEAKLAEMASGAEVFQAVNHTPFPDDPAWMWSAALVPHATAGLYEVTVVVERQAGPASSATFTLKRLMRQPEVLAGGASAF